MLNIFKKFTAFKISSPKLTFYKVTNFLAFGGGGEEADLGWPPDSHPAALTRLPQQDGGENKMKNSWVEIKAV